MKTFDFRINPFTIVVENCVCGKAGNSFQVSDSVVNFISSCLRGKMLVKLKMSGLLLTAMVL
jgi:hypothetical protein